MEETASHTPKGPHSHKEDSSTLSEGDRHVCDYVGEKRGRGTRCAFWGKIEGGGTHPFRGRD